MNLQREPLLIEMRNKQAFYGGSHNIGHSRHILDKFKRVPTSEGMKQKGFGRPHSGRKLRYVKDYSLGEKLTGRKAPAGIDRFSYRRRRFLHNSLNLPRTPLLLDDLNRA